MNTPAEVLGSVALTFAFFVLFVANVSPRVEISPEPLPNLPV